MSKQQVAFNGKKRRTRADPDLFNAKRRLEIIKHARHVGAGDTDDFNRWLVAFVWQNPKADDPVWSVMEAAKRMGGAISVAEAEEVVAESYTTRRQKSADNLARWLGLTYADRQALGITTIGSINVPKSVRQELRKFRDREAKLRKRRASGAMERAEYESQSVAEQARQEGVSRMTIYRRRRKEQARNQPNVTGVSAASLLTSKDGPVTQGRPSEASPRREARGLTSRDCVQRTAYRHAALSLELRLIALGLPLPEPVSLPESKRVPSQKAAA